MGIRRKIKKRNSDPWAPSYISRRNEGRVTQRNLFKQEHPQATWVPSFDDEGALEFDDYHETLFRLTL